MSTVIALHGIFGLPSDWEPVFANLDVNYQTPNLYTDLPIKPFKPWATHFNETTSILPKTSPNILVGYSLGGRLALHALLDNPQQWDAAVIISSSAGLGNPDERQRRQIDDDMWAERIRTLPWDVLMQQWNARDIFKDEGKVPDRKESEYDRQKLADALKIWSLGSQEDLQNMISYLRMPILWVVGAKDVTYLERSKKLQLWHPESKVITIEEAGHRVPMQNPQALGEQIREFIEKVTLQRIK